MTKKLPRAMLLTVLLAVFIQGTFLFAQEAVPAQEPARKFKESDYYYYNVTIEKVYAHRLGYMVVYRKGASQTARTFLPMEWFNSIGEGAKGELIGLSTGSDWPSMSVYYKNGQFSHVRLRLRQNRAHPTWGVIPLNMNLDEQFQGIEEVKLEF